MTPTAEEPRRRLRALARAMSIETRWQTFDGETRACSDDTLLAVLRMLGVDVRRPEDAGTALAELQQLRAATVLDPVVVAWDGAHPVLHLRVPAALADAPFEVAVDGAAGSSRWRSADLRVSAARALGDTPGDNRSASVGLEVVVPQAFAPGRYAVHASTRAGEGRAVLVAAPAHLPAGSARTRTWGLFAPVYALHDAVQAGPGDLGTLDRLAEWLAERGGSVVATLPILATFVGHGAEPCDPSPYAPVSRRYWSELHLDLAGVPELRGERAEVPATGRRLDLPRVAAARRVALERAVARLGDDGARQRRFDEWCAMHPDVHDYAAFRARVEGSGDAGRALHAYVQWSMAEQLTELARRVDARGQSLCLDLPIGVHRAGYDVAEHPELFVAGASIGAPPDLLQPAGQDWGAPPLHPHAQRADGYAYLAACLDEHLRYARALRIDHVMGLHRIWMIPPGASPADGAYVHFAAEEQWAVVCLAAAEHDATVVGENLGTVPAETERALRRHRALGTWVLQFAVPDREDVAVAAPRPGDLACVDTHDLPTFATWWHGLPPGPRGALLQTLRNAGELQTDYGETIAPEDVLTAVLAWIGRSRAPVVLASLEDLWLEPDPQNIPGAAHQDASFRQRCAFGLDELDGLASVTRAIGALARSRPHTVARAPARTA